MEKADFLLKAKYVLTMEGDGAPLLDGAVAVRHDRIVDVGPAGQLEKIYVAGAEIDTGTSILMPGLVNTHTHAAMVYFRGLADDLPLKEWLEGHIWPAEGRWLSDEFVRDATELACAEMVLAGVTMFNDMYFFGQASGESARKIGIRAVLGAGILDFPSVAARGPDEYISKAEDLIERFGDDPLVTPCVAPHAPYTCGPDTYRKAVALAERYDVPLHTHMAETRWEVEETGRRYGMSPVEYLHSTGALSPRLIAAHCVWLEDRDIELLAASGASVAHCPESNLKLSSGVAPVVKMMEAGIRVSIGTDGAASNNDLDVLGEISTAARLHKAMTGDPTAIDARTAVAMATRYGAEALGMGDRLGRLARGFMADMTVVSLDNFHLVPVYDVYSHLVYSAKSSDVSVVMINGRLVVQDGRLVTGSREDILARARSWAERIRNGQV